MSKTLIIIIGPTAIGKTELSIKLAEYYKTSIISADSRQFYKEMNIGTAVPSSSQLGRIKHHFIQQISINEYYNASKFEMEALELLNDLFKINDYVIMTGGSGLYIDAIYNGIDDLPTIPAETRAKFQRVFEEKGITELQKLVAEVDPFYYQKVDKKNPKRLLKALEVFDLTGKPYSEFLSRPRKKRDFDVKMIGLKRDREELYSRINQRVELMIESGLIEEAKELFSMKHLNALNTVGYKELFDYFDGKTDLKEAIRLIKRNTRHYARRQFTWFSRYKDIPWFEPEQTEEIIQYLKG